MSSLPFKLSFVVIFSHVTFFSAAFDLYNFKYASKKQRSESSEIGERKRIKLH